MVLRRRCKSAVTIFHSYFCDTDVVVENFQVTYCHFQMGLLSVEGKPFWRSITEAAVMVAGKRVRRLDIL